MNFSQFFSLGFHHLIELGAWDHQLFLATIVLGYLIKDWKKWILLASSFAIGHTLSVFLLSIKVVPLGMAWVEPAIAASIVLLAILDIYFILKENTNKQLNSKNSLLAIITLLFGLIHGLGFGSKFVPILLGDLSSSELFTSLIAFTLGVEAAQFLIILCFVFIVWLLFDIFKLNQIRTRIVLLAIIALLGCYIFSTHF